MTASEDNEHLGSTGREVLADVHHRLGTQEATRKADALAHVYDLAESRGATPDDLAKIRGEFKTIAQALVRESPQRRRRRWRSKRERESASNRELPAGRVQRELPPGTQ